MKFRLREGFFLFRTIDEALEYESRGELKSGVTPVARGGQENEYPLQVIRDLQRQGTLGKLEPIDDEARAIYGDTQPAVSARITNPERYVRAERTYVNEMNPFSWKG